AEVVLSLSMVSQLKDRGARQRGPQDRTGGAVAALRAGPRGAARARGQGASVGQLSVMAFKDMVENREPPRDAEPAPLLEQHGKDLGAKAFIRGGQRIILGVFVDTAMKSLVGNREERLQEFADGQRQMRSDLTELCAEADLDADGKLTVSEWNAAMKNERLVNYLEVMEWRPNEVRDFLTLMCQDTSDGTVAIDVFVRACMRFKGAASCYDMSNVLSAVDDLKRLIKTAPRPTSRPQADGAAGAVRW
ncbi:unnamed protein product, partial [Prorocentrum cordatum]